MLSKNKIFVTIISLVLFTSFFALAAGPGKVKVKITGTTMNITGEYDCVKCGDYFYPLEKKEFCMKPKLMAGCYSLQMVKKEFPAIR